MLLRTAMTLIARKSPNDYFACFTKRRATNEPGSEEGGGQ